MSKRITKKRPAANWTRWRETTNQLVDLLDRGLRKLEERTDVLEKADHGSFVAALSKIEERLDTVGPELASRIAGLSADFERFRSDARTRLTIIEEGRDTPDAYCADAEGKEGIWLVSLSDGGIVHFVQKLEL
jgi:hypothetical protein